MKLWPLFWRRALKAAHVSLSGAWFGAAICLVLLCLPDASTVGEGITGVTYCMHLLDNYVIIPTASAVVLTGLLYGFYTKWGFLRFHWVVVKWIATLLFIAFGALLLGPWIDAMHSLAGELGAGAFEDPRYSAARQNVILWGAVQTLALCALVFVSIYKPWGPRKGVAPTR